ncbi:MAG: histidinol-phosphate transaminase [Methanothrix sp.]|uniref:histidinol-phosphate transaminase n=1 Tax=Methanothrix sp. TaxID=90426 RepID=UPI0025FFB45B|nr:histidinol-phosphate transaminase [Methanothrix sp.]MCQ8903743.1 histidinol-phosphate transaminase [Methanothrix sp.]
MGYRHLLVDALQSVAPDDPGISIREIERIYGIPGERIVFLSRNENPYGPSPEVIRAVSCADLRRYPSQDEFLSAAAEYLGVSEDLIIAGAGLDGIIDSVSRLFLERGRSVFIPVPTYTYYELASRLCGATPVLSRDLRAIPKDTSLTFICSPNNPTGELIDDEMLREVIEGTDSMVFLDEAYAEFAGVSHADWVERYENLIVGRTLSKAFGLAGLRIGYAVAPEWVVEQYNRAAPVFGISAPAIAGGVAALRDLNHMRSVVERIVAERERMAGSLRASQSHANFLYVETMRDSSALLEDLLKEGISVKDCSGIPGSDNHHIRVTIGTPEQNDAFLEAYRRADGSRGSR